MSFLTNRAAVHMEKGDLEAAMADCQTAVEKARQIMPVDFKIIAKCALLVMCLVHVVMATRVAARLCVHYRRFRCIV